MKNRTYIAIDLKSFYASVECRERELNPLTANLVVADPTRTEKTICLAVSPAMKAYGIPGRARLFEVLQRVKEVNAGRRECSPGKKLSGSSADDTELKENPSLKLDFIIAPPRMAYYIEYSTRIYDIYLKYISPEDIHVYSIDEVFIDATNYLDTYKMTARELVMKMVLDVLETTGITATAGIGTNLYLCKIAMDIMAKHIPPDENGVRIAELDEMSYRKELWAHRPLTDFWRIGRGYSEKLAENGMFTMGDIARCSLGKRPQFYSEELLYKLFGVNAELLIDHAWGFEPCTIADIKAYRPQSRSISSGQVLQTPYNFDKTRLIIREMADLMALELVKKEIATNQIILNIGYDTDNLKNAAVRKQYKGEVVSDRFGRKMPKGVHGSENLGRHTSSAMLITDAAMRLFDRIADTGLLVRRVSIAAADIIPESETESTGVAEQLDFFNDYDMLIKKRAEEARMLEKEKRLQKTVISIKGRYGKNAVLKGMNFKDGATAVLRNSQIGGHKA